MIINKNIDKSLWLILNADRRNGDKIFNFISGIPDELKLFINERMSLYEEYKKNDEKKLAYLCGEYNTSNGLLYYFLIDTYFNEIDIGAMTSNGSMHEDIFKMSLSLDNDLSSIRNFDKKYLGRIEYDINMSDIDGVYYRKNFSENVYNFFKSPLGYIVVYSENNEKNIKHRIDRVNIPNIDIEFDMDDVVELDSVKKFVRRRKK